MIWNLCLNSVIPCTTSTRSRGRCSWAAPTPRTLSQWTGAGAQSRAHPTRPTRWWEGRSGSAGAQRSPPAPTHTKGRHAQKIVGTPPLPLSLSVYFFLLFSVSFMKITRLKKKNTYFFVSEHSASFSHVRN